MHHKVRQPIVRRRDARRTAIAEPVFGQVKEERGFAISTSWLPVVAVSLMFSGIIGGLYLWRRLYVRRAAA